MRVTRVYTDQDLAAGSEVLLPAAASHHLVTVLRARNNQPVVLFNNNGNEYVGVITLADRKQCRVLLNSVTQPAVESPIDLHLYQAISRGEKMDLTIQKAVELGVVSITPMFSERCGVKLNQQRLVKKQQHWQQVVISAAEQSGRVRLPKLYQPLDFAAVLSQMNCRCLLLSPTATQSISKLRDLTEVALLIGPEGGFSDQEITLAESHGVVSVCMGPRVLRTETAGLTALSILQANLGDI